MMRRERHVVDAPDARREAAKKESIGGSNAAMRRNAHQGWRSPSTSPSHRSFPSEGQRTRAELEAPRLLAAEPRRCGARAILLPKSDPGKLRTRKDVAHGKTLRVIDRADEGVFAAGVDLDSGDEAAAGGLAGELQIDGIAVDAWRERPDEFRIGGEGGAAFVSAGIGDSARAGESDDVVAGMQEGRAEHGVLLPLDKLIGAAEVTDGFANTYDGFVWTQKQVAREDETERRQTHGEAQAPFVLAGSQRSGPGAHAGFAMKDCAGGNLVLGWHAEDAETKAVAGYAAEQLSHGRGAELCLVARGTEERGIAELPARNPEGVERRRVEEMNIGDVSAAREVGERDEIIAQNAAGEALPATAPALDSRGAHTANIISSGPKARLNRGGCPSCG